MKFGLDKYINKHSLGYDILIYNKGEVREYIYGNREVYPRVLPCNKNTLFDIASLTKTYTATLVYILYQEKKINIYDKVRDIDKRFIYLEDVKVIDLLSHNQEILTDGYLGDATSKKDFYDILFTVRVVSNVPTYLDVHYIILGVLVELVTGVSLDKLWEDKIFKKLGLTKTTVNPTSDNIACNNWEVKDGVVINNKLGEVNDKKARVAKDFDIVTGHAGLFTTGRELLKFLLSFFNNNLIDGDTLKVMLKHHDINGMNKKLLEEIGTSDDINWLYKKALKEKKEINVRRTYNFMSARYYNLIDELNDVPKVCSKNTITFSGYTGPTYLIDFERKIIIVIMCNVLNNTLLDKKQRKKLAEEVMDRIANEIYSEN